MVGLDAEGVEHPVAKTAAREMGMRIILFMARLLPKNAFTVNLTSVVRGGLGMATQKNDLGFLAKS